MILFIVLKEVSLLEEDNIDEDQKDFKDAILSGTLSDEYNLTENQIEILSDIKAQEIISRLLDAFFMIAIEQLRESRFNKLYISIPLPASIWSITIPFFIGSIFIIVISYFMPKSFKMSAMRINLPFSTCLK